MTDAPLNTAEYFGHIPDEPLPKATAKSVAAQVEHPCEHCAGSGKWVRPNFVGDCHACKGRGYFKTSAEHRRKTRGQVIANKARKLADAQGIFEENHPDLIKALKNMTSWNDFAQSLCEQYGTRGSLSDKQVAAAERMVAKTAATRAAKATEREETVVDLSRIREMFNKASEGRVKPPTYRAEGLIISPAPNHGKNPGCLYVKFANGVYVGKITAENTFYEVNAGFEGADQPSVATCLQTIAADPRAAAVRYGQKYEICSCCGATLTDPVSIEAGIGPTCAKNFGL